jgi:hypothetical protein
MALIATLLNNSECTMHMIHCRKGVHHNDEILGMERINTLNAAS